MPKISHDKNWMPYPRVLAVVSELVGEEESLGHTSPLRVASALIRLS